MRLTFEKFSGRAWKYVPVIDDDTGKKVGYIRSGGSARGGGIDVYLFDKYHGGEFHRYEECLGFVKGVEAVLNYVIDHLTDVPQSAIGA